MESGTVSVADSATEIAASDTDRIQIIIRNEGSGTVFIGGNNSVTTSNGFPIKSNETLTIGDYNGIIYGIVASGTSDVSFSEEEKA